MANYIDNTSLSQILTYLKKYIDDIANTKQNNLNRTIWGAHDTGGDISGNMFVGDSKKVNNYLEYANGAINLQGNIFITGGNAATKDYVNTAIGNLQIGGRNLLRNSKIVYIASNTGSYNFISLCPTVALKPSSVYQFSVDSTILNSGTATKFSIFIYDITHNIVGSEQASVDISSDRKIISLHTSPAVNSDFCFLMYAGVAGSTSGNSLTWKNIKLEEGNKYTSWSPAPEDIDASIASAITTAEGDAATKYLPLLGNAVSATKLQTPRTLWGQSFDGNGNVDGNLTITASYNNSLILSRGSNSSWSIINSPTSGEGNFHIQNNYSGGAVPYFDVLTLAYSTGNAVFKGTVTSPTFIGALTGNADTTTKLQTTRSIWGQNFNGTGNVDGNLFIGSGKIIGENTFSLDGIPLHGIAIGHTGYDSCAFGEYGGVFDFYRPIKDTNATKIASINVTNSFVSSKFGVGVTNPNYKLDVNGDGHFAGPVDVGGVLQLSNSGLKFADNAFGGGGDIAKMYLTTKGGEATTMTFEVGNDGDDTINFITPSSTGLTHNNNIILDSLNYKTYALPLHGTADTATKLATARTIWGQSFDGSGNVDGTLSIKNSSGSYGEGIRIHTATDAWTTLMFCGDDNTGDSGTSVKSWSFHTNNNTFQLGHNSTGNVMYINSSNNIGIGNTNPNYKLDVTGTIGASGNVTAPTFIGSLQGSAQHFDGASFAPKDGFIYKYTHSIANTATDFWYVRIQLIGYNWNSHYVGLKLDASFDNISGQVYANIGWRNQMVINSNQFNGCHVVGIYATAEGSGLPTYYIKIKGSANGTANLKVYSDCADFDISESTDASSYTYNILATSGITVVGTVKTNYLSLNGDTNPTQSNTYVIGSSGNDFKSVDTRWMSVRHIDASRSAGENTLILGYGAICPTTSIALYYSTASVKTQIAHTAATGFYIDNGNLGIGTTATTYKLDVNGNSNITGNLSVSSNITANGNADFRNAYIDSLILKNTTPIYFNGTGTGTYNIGVLMVNANGITVETPRASDNSGATILPFIIHTRGGQAAPINAGSFVNMNANDASKMLRGDGGVATFNWTCQTGQPTYVWGGTSQHNYAIWNPSNFNVNYATSAGNANKLEGFDETHFLRERGNWADGANARAGLSVTQWISRVNYQTDYGDSLHIQGTSTWYNRLDFGTNGRIYFYQAINPSTLTGCMQYKGALAYLSDTVAASTKVIATIPANSSDDLVYANIAGSDYFRIHAGGDSDGGWAEIATADGGNEPIYARQYTGAFANIARTLTLLDENGNTNIPGSLYVGGALVLPNNTGLTIKDKNGNAQRTLFISASDTVYFGCNDSPKYTLFEGSELQFNVYNSGWQSAMIIDTNKQLTVIGDTYLSNNVTCNGDFTANFYTRLATTNISGIFSIEQDMYMLGGKVGGFGLTVTQYYGGSSSTYPTLISRFDNVVLLMTAGWYKLPDMSIFDDGHFIMIKRMLAGNNDNSIHLITGNGLHSSGTSPSRSAMIVDQGAYGVQYDLLSLMDSCMFVYARDLTWGSYTGVWVQWKTPRAW